MSSYAIINVLGVTKDSSYCSTQLRCDIVDDARDAERFVALTVKRWIEGDSLMSMDAHDPIYWTVVATDLPRLKGRRFYSKAEQLVATLE